MIIFLNLNKKEIKHKGKIKRLTENEFKMAELIFLNKKEICINEMTKYIWGERKIIINTNNISQLLCRVRKKIKECDIDVSFKLMSNNNSIIINKMSYLIIRSDSKLIYILLNTFI